MEMNERQKQNLENKLAILQKIDQASKDKEHFVNFYFWPDGEISVSVYPYNDELFEEEE